MDRHRSIVRLLPPILEDVAGSRLHCSFSCAKHHLVCNNVQCAFLKILTHRATHRSTHRFGSSTTHPDHPRRQESSGRHHPAARGVLNLVLSSSLDLAAFEPKNCKLEKIPPMLTFAKQYKLTGVIAGYLGNFVAIVNGSQDYGNNTMI
ncbi:hypothetical protein PUN28_003690 [Cardiocondyla obscurior]|uniref:Uncharacterized protein n=1 Tax=Cardiocondyla obscurior TaxID=286306 RepID=A0AAW2GLR8_9HYME